jgi:predicted nucleotidyltransferase component of viral defense system
MIPISFITAWRSQAPWPETFQVEQDLVLSKALVQIYADTHLKDAFAFRGGTSLQKIFFPTPTRYSEDIDLVQVRKEPMGPSVDKLRALLDPWLGKPKVERGDSRFTLKYKYTSEEAPVRPMRLKVEINTGEHFTVLGYKRISYQMQNDWFSGSADVLTFEIEEVLGTKIRALFQRKKGRDLYDMSMAFQHIKGLDDQKMVDCFNRYMKHEGKAISRAEYEANLYHKAQDAAFAEDIQPLLKPGSAPFDVKRAALAFKERTLALLEGDPWKGPQTKTDKKKSKPT